MHGQDGRCDMRLYSLIITDYHKKANNFASEMYSTICEEWTTDHFGVGLM